MMTGTKRKKNEEFHNNNGFIKFDCILIRCNFIKKKIVVTFRFRRDLIWDLVAVNELNSYSLITNPATYNSDPLMVQRVYYILFKLFLETFIT